MKNYVANNAIFFANRNKYLVTVKISYANINFRAMNTPGNCVFYW